MRPCHRCEDAVEDDAPEALCEECFAFMGPRHQSTDRVCDYCGDTWHGCTTPMCSNCFVQEGPLAQFQHAH